MPYYIVNEPNINIDGKLAIPVELYDSVPGDISSFEILVEPDMINDLASLSKTERIEAYQKIIESDSRVASFLEVGEAYELFTGDLTFPITIQK